MRPALLCSFLFCLVSLSAQSILTKHVIAGPGDSGDGGAATSAWLRYPEATAADTAGNLYLSDAVCGCIRKISPDGIITTIAGGGPVPAADGVPAYTAYLGSIYGLAVSANGLYLSSTNNQVYMIDSGGVLYVVAGTGEVGSRGDGGPATEAQLYTSGPIAFGPDGSLYIAERYNYRVRRITPDGIIQTVAGDGTQGDPGEGDGGPAVQARLNYLYDILLDAYGNLYVDDACRIRKVTPDGLIRTIAGTTCGYSGDGGPATSARFGGESGIAIDFAGNLYIAESDRRIRMVGTDGNIYTIGGDGALGVPVDGGSLKRAEFGFPYRLSSDVIGNLFVTDLYNKRVFQVDGGGTVRCAAGSEDPLDGGPAAHARINFPTLAIGDTQGNIYVADSYAGRVRKISRDGTIGTVAGKGNDGTFGDGEGGPGTGARIGMPAALAFDAAGNLFIGTTQVDFRVLKLSPAGKITTVVGSGTLGYSGDGGPATKARIRGAASLAFDRAGNLYLSDSLNHAIRKVTPDGTITTFAGGHGPGFAGDGKPAGQAQLNNPQGLFFDGTGNLFIADFGNYRVRKVTPDGVITTIAGDGRADMAGDEGPALQASLTPRSVAVDVLGNIFVADSWANPWNHRIRWIAPDGTIRSAATVGTGANISLAPDGTLLLVEGTWSQVSRLAP